MLRVIVPIARPVVLSRFGTCVDATVVQSIALAFAGSYCPLNVYGTAGDTTCVTHECFNPIKILTIAQRCEINFISLWESTWYFMSVARTFSVQTLL